MNPALTPTATNRRPVAPVDESLTSPHRPTTAAQLVSNPGAQLGSHPTDGRSSRLHRNGTAPSSNGSTSPSLPRASNGLAEAQPEVTLEPHRAPLAPSQAATTRPDDAQPRLAAEDSPEALSPLTQPDGARNEDRRGPGRPRDPDLEERVFDAVLGVYGRKGWSGLTIGEVAAQARVGKSSIYLRWPDKRALLVAALQRHQFTMDEIDPRDSPRDFLVNHALRRADSYLGQYGLAFIRLHVEARAYPQESEGIRRQALTRPALDQRERLQRALNLSGPHAHAAIIQILDTLEGAVLMHILASPPELEERVRAKLPTYAVDLVDMLLARWRTEGV